MDKEQSFNRWYWKKWIATFKRKKLDHYIIPHTKINSKESKDLNVKPKTTQLLRKYRQ